MRHYHVLQGLAGLYMPDSNIHCTTLKDARQVAQGHKKEWLDSVIDDGLEIIIRGNIKHDKRYEVQHITYDTWSFKIPENTYFSKPLADSMAVMLPVSVKEYVIEINECYDDCPIE